MRPAEKAAAPRRRPAPQGQRLRIATYNIHGCIGMDGRYAPNRIAAVLQALDADVIGLQEVDSRRPPYEELPQFRYFERATGLHAVAGPAIRDPRGDYGNMILTRLKPRAVRHIDLSVPGREPRGALDVDLKAPDGGILRVINLHLGLQPAERARQIDRLIEALEHATETGLRTVLIGDFNEWSRGARARLAEVTAQFPAAIVPRSYPAPAPLLRLDRIYASPAPAWIRPVPPATILARYSSDHLPVCVELAWGPAAAV